ncbi:MAG: DUF4149 domain-containing protein [Candidatus Eremiobacteraeota bacterium]|nr:DUF4149 domain-containing protein [Candidatus Eremiobacteraeota bacterium]
MLNVIRLVALGLWTGALAGFAFFFAPIAFAHVGPTPAFAGMIAACVLALARFGWLLGGIAVAATIFDRGAAPLAARISTLAVILAIGLSIVEVVGILPQMQNTPLGTPAYDALHRQSGLVYGLALLSALNALVASSWRPVYR